jgi:hypothetical protein
MMNDLPAHIRMFQIQPEYFAGNTESSESLYRTSLIFARENHLQVNYTIKRCTADLKKIFGQYYVRVDNKRRFVFPEDLLDIVNDLIKTEYLSDI